MDKTAELGTKSIGKLLAQYSIPAVIAMLVNAIYNVIDRIFIGQYAGEEALAGLTIAFPIMMIIFAFASLIGAGGASLLSIRLGEKDEKGASHVFGNTLSFGIIVTIITLVGISTNLESLLGIFGATDDVLDYSLTYMTIIIGGFIFQMISFILNSSVRTEGQPILSMIAMMSSAITNIVLDYIFIGLLGWGVAGAAYATIAGQFVGLGILLSFYLKGKSHLHLELKDFVPDIKIIGKIISIGFATFISTMGTSIAMTFLNRGLAEYGGTAAITSMGAINSLYTFFIMPIMGITQGMQPIIGYNHGANNRGRVNKTLKLGILIGVSFSSIVFLILQVFPNTFVTMFLEAGSSTVDIAINGLRIFMLMLPLLSINLLGVAYFQAIARGKMSIVLGMLRQFIFLLPLLFFLPQFFGLNGVWAATPIADCLAVMVTVIVLLKDSKNDTIKNNSMNNIVLE
ncbi:MATE family efflux transporter [Vallitalea okinawensis]|uniref:MATE family efflux transporter n=1 Tax=Vallitalea okinawensis TaxID=2078660 RepID=UPI0013009045|nr:MATE family efflux transporter [Vallitalea okinawensis]